MDEAATEVNGLSQLQTSVHITFCGKKYMSFKAGRDYIEFLQAEKQFAVERGFEDSFLTLRPLYTCRFFYWTTVQ